MTMDRTQRSALVAVALMTVLYAAALFGTAGRLDIVEFWCWIAVLTAAGVISLLVIDPDLIRERMRPGGKQPPLGYWFVSLLFFAHLAAAGLDRGRLHWSDSVPPWLRILALAAFAVSWVPFVWAMQINRFFSPVVRIQTERGHRLVSDGPYGFVRHPGYAAALLAVLASGMALGSWLAAVIGWLGVPILLWRTCAEDRFLHAHLPGYTEYAARVRSRLLPGVW